MTERPVERRLVAILAADVAGYSRLMGEDEEGTRVRLRSLQRDLIDPLVAQHQGRIFKTMGDGLLAEFASVVEALRCAIALQSAMAAQQASLSAEQRLSYRIGIHMGDVMQEAGDIFGDGVNIAARIESQAEPGSVYLSEDAQRQVLGKVTVGFDDLGERALKNIQRPIRLYRVAGAKGAAVAMGLPDKPSIAILPFQNMSGDPEQDYFADGMVEEITMALSRLKWLFVIARNSAFAYKGRAIDVKQIGRELGVRYVLEGSVRKAGNRLRITGQLIDATTNAHIWADRFDGAMEDVFELQDQVAAKVAGAIGFKVEMVEIERAKQKPTERLDAYDYYLRGLAHLHLWTKEGNELALADFKRACELDPGFAAAHGLAARCYNLFKFLGWRDLSDADRADAERYARRALQIGKDDAMAMAAAGIAIGYLLGNMKEARAWVSRAILLNPNLAWAWLFSAWIHLWTGDHDLAVEDAAKAMRLSPGDPQLAVMQSVTARAHFGAGRFAEGLEWAEAAVATQSDFNYANWIALACAVRAENAHAVDNAINRLRRFDPSLNPSGFLKSSVFDQGAAPEKVHKEMTFWADSLRKAGISIPT